MKSVKNFPSNVIACAAGLFLAALILPTVSIEGNATQTIKTLFFAGIALGLINFFVKPVIKILAYPLKFITFGLIGLIINMVIIEGIDIIFPEIHIKGLWALFMTSLIVYASNFLVNVLIFQLFQLFSRSKKDAK